jgi:hypothetical protein
LNTEIGVGEVGVGESEAELESGLDVLLVEAAIVDEEVPVLVVALRDCGAVVGLLFCDGVWKFSAW